MSVGTRAQRRTSEEDHRIEPAAPSFEGAGRIRELAALLLITAGMVWALARGLHFYGLAPAHIAYDLDQPPVLLLLVGGWVLCRSRAR